MTPGARLSAAIEVLAEVEQHRRPASEALKGWGLGHRFAGSGDRAAIGNLVFDALRHRASAAAAMEDDSPRSLALRTLATDWEMKPEAIAALATGEHYAPSPLSVQELAGLSRALPADAPAYIKGDFPEWLAPLLEQTFGETAAAQGAAFAERAPIDLRANTLKASRDKVLKALQRYDVLAAPYSPSGVRIRQAAGTARSPHVEAEAAHGKGWFEVQDEGSQLAILLSGAGPRMQVLDLCAGAGGKSLGLAASMGNTGQLYAYDSDRLRLRPIFERLKRAGVRNVQVLSGGQESELAQLGPRMDLVLVDAPCTGSGTWRRRPDAKWRLKPEMLQARLEEQRLALDQAAPLVKPGGRLVYVTCSLLPPENREQIEAFMARWTEFRIVPWPGLWTASLEADPPASADGRTDTLLMTPLTHGTDGFYVAVLERAG